MLPRRASDRWPPGRAAIAPQLLPSGPPEPHRLQTERAPLDRTLAAALAPRADRLPRAANRVAERADCPAWSVRHGGTRPLRGPPARARGPAENRRPHRRDRAG